MHCAFREKYHKYMSAKKANGALPAMGSVASRKKGDCKSRELFVSQKAPKNGRNTDC